VSIDVAVQEPILVTGATGFVGRALVRELLATGVADAGLRLSVRDRQAALRLGLPAAALRAGDLGDIAALRAAAAGVRTVFHLAGAVKALARSDWSRANAAGTRHLLDALDAAAPAVRLVHVSSLAAAGPSTDGRGSDALPDAARPRSRYGESKRQGELEVARSGRGRWIVLRPPIVYGPGDAATRLLVSQACAPVTFVPWRPRPLSLLHVDDLVRALLLAATSAASGVFVPLDGPARLDSDELMRALARAHGARARLLRAPAALLWPAALAADLWHRLRRRAGYFGCDKLSDVLAPGWVADPEPARRLLGFVAHIDHERGMRALTQGGGAT
jgi:nucleoside-diphosphate-sugar epimerase